MNHQLTASIIIIGYNGKSFLEQCIKSAIDQNYPADKYEIIYADNASVDGSVEFVMNNFPTVRIITFEQNLGFAGGNNKAVTSARGKYLVFMNQDTVAHRDWLTELIKTVESSPQVKAAHAAGLPLILGETERVKPIKHGFISEVSRYGAVEPVDIMLPDQPIPTLHVGGGSMILDSGVIDELGYIFDPDFFAYCEDLDLGLRLNGIGYQVLFATKAISYHHREGRTQLSKQTFRRTELATRNRFLAYLRNMYGDEFIICLPLFIIGSISKMNLMIKDPFKRVIYAFGLVPFTLYCLLSALARLPRHKLERRRILSSRAKHHDHLWLYKELLSKGHGFTPVARPVKSVTL